MENIQVQIELSGEQYDVKKTLVEISKLAGIKKCEKKLVIF